MKYTKAQYAVLAFTLAYFIPFAVYFTAVKNYEFLLYVAQIAALLGVVGTTLHRTQFRPLLLWGLSLWGFLHMAGGGIKVNGDVLYALPVWRVAEVGDTYIFKFDQLVHAFGFFVATFVVYHFMRRAMEVSAPRIGMAFIAALGGMGLGAINEIIEFIPVLMLPETGVGGYYNTALDLVANAIGALTAAGFIVARKLDRAFERVN